MLGYLIVILDRGAVPFCYYTNPLHHPLAEPALMPLALLESVIRYAETNGLFLNFLFGNHQLPEDYERAIATVNHVKIIPALLHDIYADGVLVLESGESDSFKLLPSDGDRFIILRAGRQDLPRLAGACQTLQGKFKRLNIHCVDVETWTERDRDEYGAQLRTIADYLKKCYRMQEEIEINALTDRMLLGQMNNCDAGIRHLTVAPDGKVYLCPGFYHDMAADAVGVFSEERSPVIDNPQLLDITHAPICSRCDAYHCKRCIYLNVNTTGELNTPSHEQCIVSHIERDVSRQLLNYLKSGPPFDRMQPIPALGYRDPFQLLLHAGGRATRSPAESILSGSVDAGEYLIQIHEMQKQILQKLGDD